MNININYLITLFLIFCLGVQTNVHAQHPEKTTKAKYEDFFRRQKQMQSYENERLKGQNAQSQKRKVQDEQHESAREKYVKYRKDQNQDLKEQKADEWIEKQNKIDEEKRISAAENYVKNKKSNLNYQIPEDIEFEIKDPVVKGEEGSMPLVPPSAPGDFSTDRSSNPFGGNNDSGGGSAQGYGGEPYDPDDGGDDEYTGDEPTDDNGSYGTSEEPSFEPAPQESDQSEF